MVKAVTVMSLLLSAAMPGEEWAASTQEKRLEGKATYMAPGIMEQVAINRELDLSGHIAGVALNRSGDLGRTVWIEWEDGSIDGPFMVVDCAQRGSHFERREQRSYVVEVPAWVARLRGFYGVGPKPARVLFDPPPSVVKVLDIESRIH